MNKKLFALVLAIAMVIALVPAMSAGAAGVADGTNMFVSSGTLVRKDRDITTGVVTNNSANQTFINDFLTKPELSPCDWADALDGKELVAWGIVWAQAAANAGAPGDNEGSLTVTYNTAMIGDADTIAVGFVGTGAGTNSNGPQPDGPTEGNGQDPWGGWYCNDFLTSTTTLDGTIASGAAFQPNVGRTAYYIILALKDADAADPLDVPYLTDLVKTVNNTPLANNEIIDDETAPIVTGAWNDAAAFAPNPAFTAADALAQMLAFLQDDPSALGSFDLADLKGVQFIHSARADNATASDRNEFLATLNNDDYDISDETTAFMFLGMVSDPDGTEFDPGDFDLGGVWSGTDVTNTFFSQPAGGQPHVYFAVLYFGEMPEDPEPSADPSTDPSVDPSADPSTDPSTDPSVDPSATASAGNNNNNNNVNEAPKTNDASVIALVVLMGIGAVGAVLVLRRRTQA